MPSWMLLFSLMAGPVQADSGLQADEAALEAEAARLEAEDRRASIEGERAPVQRKRVRKDDSDGPSSGDLAKWLGLVGLLLLWLLTRKTGRKSEPGRDLRHELRKAPLDHDELGRAVFEAVLNADLDAYRELYLNGAEAGRVMGTVEAARYLELRTPQMLEDALVELSVLVPEHSVYVDSHVDDQNQLTLTARRPDDQPVTVPIGRFVKVGAILRLERPLLLARDAGSKVKA